MPTRGQRKPSANERILVELGHIRQAIDNLSANMGKWLGTVAQAAANPADNSAEVQQAIDKLAGRVDDAVESEEDALGQLNQKEK